MPARKITNNNRIRRMVQDAAPLSEPVVLPAALTAVSAASQRQGPVSPGEIVTIFGAGMARKPASRGPSTLRRA